MKIINEGFTHAGIFHSDDVFSAALLKYIYPSIKIIRGFKVPDDFEGIVFDIGFGEFDHHQENKRVRENGMPYAAFGLLWERFGANIVGEEEAAEFDEDFIQQLDYSDNTGENNILASVIASFNPTWNSEKNIDEAFDEAVEFAMNILNRQFEYIFSKKKGENIVRDIVKNSASFYVSLPYFVPWKNVVCDTDKKFVIYPSERGGFNAQAVPIDKDSIEVRCPFPKEWCGRSADEIYELTKIKGISFCHNGRFLISAESENAAIKACEIALKEGEVKL